MPLFRKGDEPVLGYRLEKFLGRGQFGDVWMATAPGRLRVALKFIDLGGKQGLKEFKGVQRVREIRHPHLLAIIALWMLDQEGHVLSDDVIDQLEAEAAGKKVDLKQTMDISFGEPALMIVAMPLGEKSLMDMLEEQGPAAFSTEELINYMEESAKGIDYLNAPKHDLGDGVRVGIQHCDIKPANIMLMGDSALVCDFGLARVLAFGNDVRATTTGMAGTPAYMAPECIEGKLPSDSTDQYSLAITYYELRTGKLPFEEESQTSQMAILTAHVKGNLDFSRLAPEEQEVIRKATSLDPAARWPSCSTMVRELRNAIATSGVYKPDVRDSDWRQAEVGGAPNSGSSVFETNAEAGKRKPGTQSGSNHETLDPDQAAAAEKTISESDVVERPATAEAAAEAPGHTKTLMPEALEQPVEEPQPRREKDTLVEELEKDTRRDSVRYERPKYDDRRGVPWGAITTVVGVLAVCIVVTINFGRDWPVVGSVLDSVLGPVEPVPEPDPEPIEPDPEKVDPDEGEVNGSGPNGQGTDNGVPAEGSGTLENGNSGTGGSGTNDPPFTPDPPEPWEEELQKRLKENQFLQACLLFAPAEADALAIPLAEQADAAGEIRAAWDRARRKGWSEESDLDLIVRAVKAVPSSTAELRSGLLRQFISQIDDELTVIEEQFRRQESVEQAEAEKIESRLSTLIGYLSQLNGNSLKSYLADAYLLSARAKLRKAEPKEISSELFAKAQSDVDKMKKVIPLDDPAAHYSSEQRIVLELLKQFPEFNAEKPLEGMDQLQTLLAIPGMEGLPRWEKQIIAGLKDQVKAPIFAMAADGKLSEAQRTAAVGLWSDLPGLDQFKVLIEQLAKTPTAKNEIDAYYASLAEIADSYLQSNKAQRGSPEWALAKCCSTEGRLWPRPVLSNLEWYDIQRELEQAKAALAGAEEAQRRTYAEFVSAVAAYLSPVSSSNSAPAELIVAAYEDPPNLLETQFRRSLGAEILSASLVRILPDDGLYRGDTASISPNVVADAGRVLDKSKQLQSDLSAHAQMYDVIVTANHPEATLAEIKAAAASAKQFDSAEGTAELLEESNQSALYTQAKATLSHRLASADAENLRNAHAAAAIAAFAELAEQLWDRRQAQILAGGNPVSSAIIYERAVEPALGLDNEANLIGAVTKESLAKAYYLKGELIRNDPSFADQFRSAEKPLAHHLVAMNAYARAAELDPQLEYFTSQGFELLLAQPGSVPLEELQPILAKVAEFENAQLDPQALRLQAKGKLLEAREILDADKLKEPIHQAFEFFRSARAKIGENDPAYPSLLTDEAGTLVAKAFTVNGGDRATQEEFLNEAVKLATKATTFEYRTHPAEAHVVLGNAKEDIGYYLHGDDPELAEKYFNEAKGHFLTALRADPTNSWRSQGKSNMSLGRLSYRHAWKGDIRNERTRRDLLEEGARYLQDAIALSQHDQYHYSQSHYWAGEIDYSLAQLNEPQREELIASADAHFEEAVTSAKEAGDDSWVAYQIPWANHIANRAIDAFNARESSTDRDVRTQLDTKYRELENRARKMITSYLAEQRDNLKPEQVYKGTLVLMRLTKVSKEMRHEFMEAVDQGIERVRVNAGKSDSFEADLRLERSEYLVNSAAFSLFRDLTPIWGGT